MNLLNISTFPWSFCSGDDVHKRILTFTEHISESSPPSQTTASPEGDSTNPVEWYYYSVNHIYAVTNQVKILNLSINYITKLAIRPNDYHACSCALPRKVNTYLLHSQQCTRIVRMP